MSDLPSNAPSPRLCQIIKWPDFDGYGFNLHADKTRPGQYIGKVDENSPADVAGLREGDRIIEVNGVNISNENHKQVVQRIKAVSNETKLLVVDSEGDRWYKEHNLVVRGDQPNIISKSSQKSSSDSPESQKSSDKNEKNANSHEEDTKSLSSSASTHSEQSTQPQQNETSRDTDSISDKEPIAALTIDDNDAELPPPPLPVDDQTTEIPLDSDLSLEYDNIRFEQEEYHNKIPTVLIEETHSLSSHSSTRSVDETSKADNGTTGSLAESDAEQEEERKSPMSTTPSPPPSLNPEGASSNKESASTNKESTSSNKESSSRSSSSINNSGLNLNMTVAEMRAHLATKKKVDPRKDTIDLKKKYQIVQNM